MTQPQFLYQLKLIPRLLDESNWTEEENRIVEKHFRHLKNLVKNGVVLHAGRTSLMDEDGFGIVIFQADSEEDAHEIMNSDPAV
ncbi:MAG: hypothetical protein H8D46_04920, partial [FCB group bacterium]|nr:hypothetical protein [FCB group bacterium]